MAGGLGQAAISTNQRWGVPHTATFVPRSTATRPITLDCRCVTGHTRGTVVRVGRPRRPTGNATAPTPAARTGARVVAHGSLGGRAKARRQPRTAAKRKPELVN